MEALKITEKKKKEKKRKEKKRKKKLTGTETSPQNTGEEKPIM